MTAQRKARPVVAKVIKGVSCTQEQFRQKLIDAVAAAEDDGADAQFIIDHWGDDNWSLPENRKLIANTLLNLERRGSIHKRSRGVYTLGTGNAKRVKYTDTVERQILIFLEEVGGFSSLSSILKHFGIDKTQDTDALRSIKRVLSLSEDIDKIVLQNTTTYHLRGDRLAALPLTGRNMALNFTATWGFLPDIEAELEDLFGRIGTAYYYALHWRKISPAEIALSPIMTEAMEEFVRRFKRAKTRYFELLSEIVETPYDLEDGVEARSLRKVGKSDTDIINARDNVKTMFEAGLPERLIDLFINGDWDTHELAPLSFYYAMGEVLELDAAQLSRGIFQRPSNS